jgi:serine O-acetyltransferase
MMLSTLRRDIQVIYQRDPAARSTLEILFCYPGLHAVWFHRLAHWLWMHKLYFLGRWTAHIARFLTGIEIHPGAKIGPGLFIDHGMGTVIGETAEIGEDVTLYHNVTLGGVSWKKEKRHPTIEDHVVVGAGAQILGPIRIGARARIGANAVVVKEAPSDSVVTGIPGRVTYRDGIAAPDATHEDLQHNQMPDAMLPMIHNLTERIAHLENELATLREVQQAHTLTAPSGKLPEPRPAAAVPGHNGAGWVI